MKAALAAASGSFPAVSFLRAPATWKLCKLRRAGITDEVVGLQRKGTGLRLVGLATVAPEVTVALDAGPKSASGFNQVTDTNLVFVGSIQPHHGRTLRPYRHEHP